MRASAQKGGALAARWHEAERHAESAWADAKHRTANGTLCREGCDAFTERGLPHFLDDHAFAAYPRIDRG